MSEIDLFHTSGHQRSPDKKSEKLKLDEAFCPPVRLGSNFLKRFLGCCDRAVDVCIGMSERSETGLKLGGR